MKFEYEKNPTPVAYISELGNLVIKLDGTHYSAVLLMENGMNDIVTWQPECTGVKHKLYPGDKITITF